MKLHEMKKTLSLQSLAALVLLIGLTACSNETDISGNDQKHLLTLNYQVDGGVEGQTYAIAAEPHEIRVDEIYTLFFRASDHATEANKYVGCSRTRVSSSASSSTAQVSLPSGNDIDVNGAWQLIFLANFDRNVDLGGASDVKDLLSKTVASMTFEEAKKYLTAYFDQSAGTCYPFPMSASVIKAASTNIANITFKRRVARVDVNNSAANFVLESVQVRNARTRGYLFDEGGTFFDGNSEEDFITGQVVEVSGMYVQGKLYAFPNFVALPTLRDHSSTCLIIGGKYAGSSETTYYRVNVSPAGAQQILLANSVYTIKITNVTGAGEKNPGDAYDNSELQIEYELNGWDNSSLGTYVFDKDGNGLAISQRNVIFSNRGAQEVQLEVFTIKSPSNPISSDWSVGGVTGTDALSFSAKRGTEELTKKYITVTTLSDNATAVDRQAEVVITWGNISIPVNITQLSPSSIALFGGIKVTPDELSFPVNGATKEVRVNLQGNFAGITRDDISASVLYDDLAGWLTVSAGTTPDSPGSGIFYYNVTALPGANVRSADVKFVVKHGSLAATAQVKVTQTMNDWGGVTTNRQLNMYMLTKNYTTNTYLFRGNLIQFYSLFKGTPEGQATANSLQFSMIYSDYLKYQMTIMSSMSWKIVAPGVTGKRLVFSKTNNPGDPTNQCTIDITAKGDTANSWSGSFYIEYENGDKTYYNAYQTGVYKILSTDNQIYFYGTMWMNGKLWLDRNIGATVGQKGQSGYYSTHSGSVITNDNRAIGVALNASDAPADICPPGFRLPKTSGGEWDYIDREIQWSGTGDASRNLPANVMYVQLGENDYWFLPLPSNVIYNKNIQSGAIYVLIKTPALNAQTGAYPVHPSNPHNFMTWAADLSARNYAYYAAYNYETAWPYFNALTATSVGFCYRCIRDQ